MGSGLIAQSKSAYVALMRRLRTVAPGIASGPPPPLTRTTRLRHWAASLTRIHDLSGMVELRVPWWTYEAIAAIDDWMLERSGPLRVFEYGSGASTVWLAQRAEEVVSVEHDPDFIQVIRQAVAEFNHVTLEYRPPRRTPQPLVPSRRHGNRGLDFADYVATLEEQGGEFDVIVIDGRARESCLAAAARHLAPNGVIVFDNSRRRRYRRAIEASGLREVTLRGLTPALPYPDQTSLLFRP